MDDTYLEAKVTMVFDLADGSQYTLTVPKVVDVKISAVSDLGHRDMLGAEMLVCLPSETHRLEISMQPLMDDKTRALFQVVTTKEKV